MYTTFSWKALKRLEKSRNIWEIILKCVLKEYLRKVLARFICFGIGGSCEPF
jgi:hypothetical protein